MIGYAETIIMIVLVITGFCLWVRGILPALINLGMGLAKRRIVIFANAEISKSIKDILTDSKLFKDKNIETISTIDDLHRGENESMYIVYWPEWKENIKEIINMKKDTCSLIVYAPKKGGFIPDEIMELIDSKRHAIVTNFRGRLLNDVLTSMITTKK